MVNMLVPGSVPVAVFAGRGESGERAWTMLTLGGKTGGRPTVVDEDGSDAAGPSPTPSSD